MYNYSKLRGKAIEKCGTLGKFAGIMGISKVSVSNKLMNKTPWGQDEIVKACNILDIKPKEIGAYFFTEEV